MDMDVDMSLQYSPPKNDISLLNNTNRKYLRKRKSHTPSSELLRTPSSDFARAPSSEPLRIPEANTPSSDVPRKRRPDSPLFFPYKTAKTDTTAHPSHHKNIPEPTNSSVHPERLALIGQSTAPTGESLAGPLDESKSFVVKPKEEDIMEGLTPGSRVLALRPRTTHCSRESVPQECFESPQINLLVGPSSAVFPMHLKLACYRSGKLRKRLTGPNIVRLQESAMEIVLENVNPEVFERWQIWAYGNENLDGYDLRLLYQLYFLATDLRSQELQNLVMDQIKRQYKKVETWPNQERAMHVYRNTAIGSPLRNFMLQVVYYRLMVLREDSQTYFGGESLNSRFVKDYVEFVQEMQYSNGFTDPRLEDGCRFHSHGVKDSTAWLPPASQRR
ncbi:hypothetical protein MMC30_007286 [Trapelia coarctata]|nr:hypothetical protein [Trapelia coarctata]